MPVAAVATTSRSTTSSVTRPGLRLGARAPIVARMQHLLRSHGFAPGAIDGFFGPKTLAAVKAFQRTRGLVVDGYVGPITWGALERAAGAGRPATTGVSGFSGGRAGTVPFLSQMRVPNGYANYACGPTSLAMVMAAEGRPAPSVLQVALRAGTQKSNAGTSHEGLIRAARSYGFAALPGTGWDALSRSLSSGHPVVAHVNTAFLSNRPYRYAGGHYVTVTGLVRDGNGRITHVICNDPATSYASRGQGVRYSVGDFSRAWAEKGRWLLGLR
ncbi:MAG: C39 family peptidase [Myxococcaceae bacterium]|nr:C39 family peptidase [Myxococcaceae bacterium]